MPSCPDCPRNFAVSSSKMKKYLIRNNYLRRVKLGGSDLYKELVVFNFILLKGNVYQKNEKCKYLWCWLNQRDINHYLLSTVKNSLVRFDNVEARCRRLHFVSDISIWYIADLQVSLQLILRLVRFGKLEAQLLIRVYLHNPRGESF